MPCGFAGDTGTRVTTNRTQCPPAGSTTSTCPSRSRSTSRTGSRGSAILGGQGYHTEATFINRILGPAHCLCVLRVPFAASTKAFSFFSALLEEPRGVAPQQLLALLSGKALPGQDVVDRLGELA